MFHAAHFADHGQGGLAVVILVVLVLLAVAKS